MATPVGPGKGKGRRVNTKVLIRAGFADWLCSSTRASGRCSITRLPKLKELTCALLCWLLVRSCPQFARKWEDEKKGDAVKQWLKVAKERYPKKEEESIMKRLKAVYACSVAVC